MADERVPEPITEPITEPDPGGAQMPAPHQPAIAPESGATQPKRVTITRTVKVKLGLTQVIGVIIVGLSVLMMLGGLLVAAVMPLGPTAIAAGARGRLYLMLFAPGGIGLLVGIVLASRPSRAGTPPVDVSRPGTGAPRT